MTGGGRRGLGRGLDALLATPDGATSGVPELIPVDQIQPSAQQVRKRFDPDALRELAESIREHGLLQPVLVTRQGAAYQLIAGERRWRAARMAGLARIPALIRAPLGETEGAHHEERRSLLLGLIENLQRADLDPIEEARGIRRLVDDFGLTHEEAARRLSRHRVAITQSLRLLTACPAVIAATSSGAISAGHARVLSTFPDHSQQEQGLKLILARHLTVRQTERWARDLKSTPARGPRSTALEETMAEFGHDLGDRLRVSVAVRGTRSRGRVTLEWSSPEEFARLSSRLLR